MGSSLEEVAKYAGVSIATVSRVYNSKPNVSATTRATVTAAIAHLGYDGHQRLAADRFRVIGVVVCDDDSAMYRDVVRVLAQSLSLSRITVITVFVDGTIDAEQQAIEMLLERRISGIAMIAGHYRKGDARETGFAGLRARSIPLVAVGEASGDAEVPSVSWDDRSTVHLAVEHLIEHGHEAIGFIARDDEWNSTERKISAFERAGANRAGGLRLLVERAGSMSESADVAATDLLARGVTALLCETDWMAVGALRAVARLGLAVPTDVSLVAFEDSKMLAALRPSVSAIRQSVEQVGRAAAHELVRQLDGGRSRGSGLTFHPELVVRESSSGSVRAGD